MSEKQHIMLDLETLGNKSNSAIIAIGAVLFDKDGIVDRFYQAVDLQSSIDAGMRVDGSTVQWWVQQSKEAQEVFHDETALSLQDSLYNFSCWLGLHIKHEYNVLWGNGANFDNKILGDAFESLGRVKPWEFWNDRCYRTIKSIFSDVKLVRVGEHHNAVDDAESQALHLIDIAKSKNLDIWGNKN